MLIIPILPYPQIRVSAFTMMNKFAAICVLILSSALALCWYPLGIISKTHLVDTQILFYAFSSAAILTVPFLFKQANQWRPHAPLLVIFAILSSMASILLQYSLLEGESLIIISIICITLSGLLLFSKAESVMTLDFLVITSITVLAIMVLFLIGGGLKNHWTEWSAVLIAVLFFGLLRLDLYSSVIPLGSRLSASLIGSTWIIGMITIFSEHFSSYIQDNAVGLSITYGSICLIPIMASVLYVLSSKRANYVLLWLPLMLMVNLFGSFLNGNADNSTSYFWLLGLLCFVVITQIARSTNQHSPSP